MHLSNTTSLSSLLFRGRSHNGVPAACCVSKASFEFDVSQSDGVLLSEVEADLQIADEYSKRTNVLRRESDLSPDKPFADIYFVAPVARSPGGQPERSWRVGMEVGDLRCGLFVTGKRTARKSPMGWMLSDIEPTTSVPIGYDLAYGGTTDDGLSYEENPVGRGFAVATKACRDDEISVPQIFPEEANVRHPLKCRSAVGLTPIPRSWAQRRTCAGTFDDHWQESRSPDLPLDFQPSFYNAAPRSLQYDGFLSGNEKVKLTGLHPTGALEFQLPVDFSVGLLLRADSDREFLSMLKLDTLVFDMGRSRIDLTWRTVFPRGESDWEAALVTFPWDEESSDAAA